MKKKAISIVIIVLIALLAITFQPVHSGETVYGANNDWPMFRNDFQHTGVSLGVQITPPLSLHFKIDLGSMSDSTPAVFNGKLYIGDGKGFMHCYDANTGKEIWSQSKGDNVSIKSSPSVFDGKVYYGDSYGRFFCLSAKSGEEEWEYQAGHRIDSSPLVSNIGGEKLVFFGSSDRTIYCLNADSGESVWQYTTGDSIYSSPALYKENIIVGSDDGNLYCFDGHSGKIVWEQKGLINSSSVHSFNDIYSSPAVDTLRQIVFVGSYNHYFYALDAETGAIKWSEDTGSEIYASPVIQNGNVFCASINKVICFDEDTGSEKWSHSFAGRLLSSPSAEFGYLFISEKEGGFSCLNMQTGESEWNFKVKSGSKSGPVPADGHIYFFGEGNIFAFTENEDVAMPTLQVSSKIFDFGKVNRGVKLSQYLYIKNISRDVLTGILIGKLEGTISTDSNWISITPSHFQSNTQTAYVTIDTSNLTEGKSYQGKIYVETNGGNAVIDVLVFILQSPNPVISTTISDINFGNVDKGENLKSTFYIENSHRDLYTGKWIGLLEGTISTDKDWISVIPASFKSNKQLVSVFVDVSSLKEGENYTGDINIKSNGGNISIPISVFINKPVQTIVITLQPDNPYMTVNEVSQEIDPGRGTKPVIVEKWNRTVVPIRAIVEALGGTIEWDGTERKVTINVADTTIELWIDKPQAKVNGIEKWIDPDNHDVSPVIVNSRTMLPLRFVAESLGAKVDWDASTKTITITYMP